MDDRASHLCAARCIWLAGCGSETDEKRSDQGVPRNHRSDTASIAAVELSAAEIAHSIESGVVTCVRSARRKGAEDEPLARGGSIRDDGARPEISITRQVDVKAPGSRRHAGVRGPSNTEDFESV